MDCQSIFNSLTIKTCSRDAPVNGHQVEKLQNQPVTTSYVRGEQLGKDLKTGKSHACKLVQKEQRQPVIEQLYNQRLRREIRIHKSLEHPNIVGFHDYFEDENFHYILLEKCERQTVSHLLQEKKRMAESEVKFYTKQIIEAVGYMHDRFILHRDLKPGNLLLQGSQIKIADFGLSTKLRHADELRREKCGTPNYMAPEVLDKERGHSFKADIWSIGVIMYTMLVGTPPFQTDKLETTYQKIQSNDWSFPKDTHHISQAARNLVSSILTTDPGKRPSLEAISSHEFFRENSGEISRRKNTCRSEFISSLASLEMDLERLDCQR
ncbi:putative protein kinase [Planoprotostelium fungivorum]|uniref:non-specific serine/threonine protein kinase n=1 Tax=Planoprotostelium fungivorum TaxID=1890364 RepID=A0A2P6MRP6_9EUKA|nr:putative protein kinase [Planoprotostelium fungivorum]PRP87784.1 putative protein kinase [Planoprotostelium fungivorum]